MNYIERKMLDVINKIKSLGHEIAIKAEFEAEGTRADELLRLIEITYRSNIKLGLKIGGCEAIRDLLEAKQFGASYIIAPMVESEYALSKFVNAKNKIYTVDEQQDTKFLINIETKTGYDKRVSIANLACEENGIDGLVFGRVDFAGSLSVSRSELNYKQITDCGIEMGLITKEFGLELVVGGGISYEAVSPLKKISQQNLTRFETRKVIFDCSILNDFSGLSTVSNFKCIGSASLPEWFRVAVGYDLIRKA